MGGFNIRDFAAEQAKFMNGIREERYKYRNNILDLTQLIYEPKFLFSIRSVLTIPLGELIGIKGRAKMGKSQFLYLLIAIMLARISKCGIKPLLTEYKILLFDTEQSQASLKKCCQRALKYAGLPIDKNDVRFIPFFMRPLSIDERKKVIEDAIREERPDIIFIDGVRDLLQDFNSLEQSGNLIQWLLRLTAEYGCTIVSVLHQNKAKDDGNMRGHLGTELLNKLTDCFEVSKKDGKFIVSCTDSRNIQCPDIAFSIDANGEFKEEVVSDDNKLHARVEEIKRVLRTCYKNKSEMTYTELTKAYAMEAAVSERTAQRAIKEAKDNDFLNVKGDYYTIREQAPTATDTDTHL